MIEYTVESYNLVKEFQPTEAYLKGKHFDMTVESALLAESASTLAHSLKFKNSSKITPRYLNFETFSINSLPG